MLPNTKRAPKGQKSMPRPAPEITGSQGSCRMSSWCVIPWDPQSRAFKGKGTHVLIEGNFFFLFLFFPLEA